MSATASKASRREIRRALGPTALELLDAHTESLTLHATRLTFLKTERDTLHADVLKLREALATAAESLRFVTHDVERLQAVRSRKLGGRLRWLVTGR